MRNIIVFCIHMSETEYTCEGFVNFSDCWILAHGMTVGKWSTEVRWLFQLGVSSYPMFIFTELVWEMAKRVCSQGYEGKSGSTVIVLVQGRMTVTWAIQLVVVRFRRVKSLARKAHVSMPRRRSRMSSHSVSSCYI